MKVIKFAPGLIPVLKHQEHDQSSHGSWAGGSVSFKQDKNSLTMKDQSGKTLASVNFVNLGNNRLDVNSIDSFDEGKGYATKVLEKLYSLFPEHSIFWGKTIVPASTHLAQKFSDKYGRTEFIPWGEGVIDGYEWGQVYGDTAVKKHQEHDQSSHGNWAKGGSGLGIEEAMALQKSSDPLKQKIYDAEELIRNPSKSKLEKPIAPEWGVFVGTRDEFDRAVKEYDKKWMAWAVEEQADILSDTGERLLDGTPSGVKKYVEEIIKSDWFIETFGDGKSLPPLDVKTSPTSVAGVHQLGVSKDRYSGRIVKRTHSITINRQFTKDEVTILHEISHYATTISQTESFSSHGVEFARNHVFISEKVAGSARAKALASAYAEKGVQDGD